ncbi:MAG: hypothetical protein H7A32_02415 [Deltaproteobacteria bacterium]|nr:hypothetical protein [Deltaproteobacteria bacterium]
MKIDGIGISFPEKEIGIDETIKMIAENSRASFEGNLDETLNIIRDKLIRSGAKTRRWLEDKERPIDHIKKATLQALEQASCQIEDIDLLIYAGVGTGFIEPGQAYIAAHALGMDSVQCFDILEACMSWTRASQIAHSFIKSGTYQRVLIVNGEFVNIKNGPIYPCNYKLKNNDELKWILPSYTIGNVAAATILSSKEDISWEWHFSGRPDYANLCTIPIADTSMFSEGEEKIGKSGVNRFTSYGGDLHRHAGEELPKVFSKLSLPTETIKKVFIHASSKTAWESYGESLGIKNKLYHIYPDYGNLVSASIPVAIQLAYQNESIKKGDQLVGLMASAGMSFCSFAFKF